MQEEQQTRGGGVDDKELSPESNRDERTPRKRKGMKKSKEGEK